MNDQQKYHIKLHEKALKEYQNLQGSDLQNVNAALEEMETRAEEVNKMWRGTDPQYGAALMRCGALGAFGV